MSGWKVSDDGQRIYLDDPERAITYADISNLFSAWAPARAWVAWDELVAAVRAAEWWADVLDSYRTEGTHEDVYYAVEAIVRREGLDR